MLLYVALSLFLKYVNISNIIILNELTALILHLYITKEKKNTISHVK